MTPAVKAWLAGLAVFAALMFLLSDVLLPFVAGMGVAYFLDPVADKVEKWGVSRMLATVIILAAFFIVAIAGIILLFPLIQAQVVGLAARIPQLVMAIRHQAEPLLATLQASLTEQQIEELRQVAGSYAGDVIGWIGGILAGLLSGGLALFKLASLLVITPVVSFYLLRDWDRIIAHVNSLLPPGQASTIRRLTVEIDDTIAGFVRGQASVCLILGVYYGTALSLAGLESGLLVGFGAGLISFIPYIGASVGLLVGVAIAIAQFPDWLPVFLVAGIFIAGQVAESYVLTPKLVGDRVGLHPVWIIFALLAGGALFDFTGVLLAVPAAAVIGVLVRFGQARYLELGQGDG